jgi:putative transposase
MKRRLFSPAEVAEALQAIEAGVRVPEVCRRHGISEATLLRWRRKAGLLRKPTETVVQVPLDLDQAANRVAGLEQRLEAFRVVLVTLLEPAQLEQASRLLEVELTVSARRARRLLGLPPVNAPEAWQAGEVDGGGIAETLAAPFLLRSVKET